MKKSRKTLIYSIGGALALTAGCTVLFSGFAEAAVRTELKRKETVSTAYNVPVSKQEQGAPEGYVKPDYTVTADPQVDNSGKKTPVGSLTKEEAAEYGARLLWEIFDADLSGATFYMGFEDARDKFPRACWYGDVRFGSERKPEDGFYTFRLDAVTGKGFAVTHEKTIGESVDLRPDSYLEKHPEEYLKLAKQVTKERKLLEGADIRCSYNCQGFAGNNPFIILDAADENGGKLHITFSRYDKALMSVVLDASIKIEDAAAKEWEEETEATARKAVGAAAR